MVWRILLTAVLVCAPLASGAALYLPASDDVIVETLPTVAGWSQTERQLRRALVQRPRDVPVALAAAQAYLEVARSQGDARYAGYAMGALQAWLPMQADTPNAILVMHATVAQYLHDFDGAEATLKLALKGNPANAQAWLTLATVLRVRGRYSESDAACHMLARLRQSLYATACLAENSGLRGDVAAAQTALRAALASPLLAGPSQAGIRQWLLTTLAELAELAGQADAADVAYKSALKTERSGYDAIAYSDFLLDQKRPAEVLPLLATEPRSDAVLLRLVMATQQLGQGHTPAAQRDVAELQARFDAAAQRPGSSSVHAREHAMFALAVRQDAPAALALARQNVLLQREPIDLLIFARAAVAAGDEPARAEVKALAAQIGLRDARLQALL